jgi:tetratricopeptide (TPR) repeat protein
LYKQNNDYESAKATFEKARQLAPNDEELKKGEFDLYFSIGVNFLLEEDKLIKEINESVADKKKYDQLMEKRKKMFTDSIPYLEKAYSIDPNDQNTIKLLKAAYDISGQPEKAKAIQ